MNQITSEQIQESYNKLPEELRKVVDSPDIHNKIRNIGDKHFLMLDQIGSMADQVGLVILGLAKASDFVKDLSERTSIDEQEAREIAEDINKEVFDVIRTKMRLAEESEEKNPLPSTGQPSTSVSAIEKAGDFEIIKEDKLTEHHDGVVAPVASPAGMETVTESPTELVAAIEKAEPITNKTLKEPLSDHLLYTLTGIPGSNLRKTVPPAQSATPSQPNNPPVIKPAVTTPTQPPKPKTFNDIYREPIE